MLNTKKIKRAAIATGLVGLFVFILGYLLSDDWSDFFSGVLVGIGGTWVVIACFYLIALFKKK